MLTPLSWPLLRLPPIQTALVLTGLMFMVPGAILAAPTHGPLKAGESLWVISGRIATAEDLSRDQIMLGLLKANPNAFANPCNLNSTLKQGAVLRIPAAALFREFDRAGARAEVARQSAAWKARSTSGAGLDCDSAAQQPPDAQSDLESEPLPTVDVEPADTARPIESSEPPCPTIAEGPATHWEPLEPHPDPLIDRAAPDRLDPGRGAPPWLMLALILLVIASVMIRQERQREITTALKSPAEALRRMRQWRLPTLNFLQPGNKEPMRLLPLAALAGILGALATVLFREGIHGLVGLLGGQDDSLIATALAIPWWQRLLLPAVGGLLAGLVLQEIGQRLRGLRTTDYMEAIAVGDGRISIRQSLVKALSSLLTVASGGSIGREGAMVQLAAMVASTLARITKLNRDSMRLLVAAGAAAGLASAYNAPIAATIFVAEIVLGSIAIDYIGPLIVAAVLANMTVHQLLGYAPVYDIPGFSIVSNWELGFYLVLGLIAGHMAPLFLSLLERAHALFARLPAALSVRLALGGLIVGGISVYEPQVWGNGYGVVNSVLLAPWAWQALLTVLVLKMLATAATHGSGAIGGAFTPTLFVGAMLGALFGTLINMLAPDGTAPASAYAVVGMGAMLAATTHAPLMSILMVLEMTMDYQIVLPLMLAVIIGHYTSRGYREMKPMYAESLLPSEKP